MNKRENWVGPYIPQGNWLRDIVQQFKLAYNLMLDRRVNTAAKIIPLAALGYLIMPIDLISDVVPVLGQLDDLAVVLFGMRMFFEFSPPKVVEEHLKRLTRRVEGDWTVVEDEAASGPEAADAEVLDEDEVR